MTSPDDLTRCSYCGRTGTLTDLSAGNTCVLQDDCEQARQDVIIRGASISRCDAPNCTKAPVYLGLCRTHAEEEYPNPNPTVEDLLGPL